MLTVWPQRYNPDEVIITNMLLATTAGLNFDMFSFPYQGYFQQQKSVWQGKVTPLVSMQMPERSRITHIHAFRYSQETVARTKPRPTLPEPLSFSKGWKPQPPPSKWTVNFPVRITSNFWLKRPAGRSTSNIRPQLGATDLDCLQNVSESGSLCAEGIPGNVFGALCGQFFQLLAQCSRLKIIFGTAKVLKDRVHYYLWSLKEDARCCEGH